MLKMSVRRRLSGITLVAALGLTVLTVATTEKAASAAGPHYENPPVVQAGWTDSAEPGTAHEWTDWVDTPLGAWRDDSGQVHRSRVYATFDLSGFAGRRIIGGHAFVQEHTAASCPKRAVEAWRTEVVETAPTWSDEPAERARLAVETDSTYCPRMLTFDVSAALLDAAQQHRDRVTLEFRVPDEHESDLDYGRQLYWYYGVRLSVAYNTVPTIDNRRLVNGGVPCTDEKPYPVLSEIGRTLQAVGEDPDANDGSLRYDFAIWPTTDPARRTQFSFDHGVVGRFNTGRVPDGVLADGGTYAWQARVSDGVDTSKWSRTCLFTADLTDPPLPRVTSTNYPPSGFHTSAPAGEPGAFTLSGNGDPDVVGFQYGWEYLGVPGVCEYRDLGRLVCSDPLDSPGAVRLSRPGGSTTLTLSPPRAGPNSLVVRSMDRAGNASDEVRYEMLVPNTSPTVTPVGTQPSWGEEVTLRFSPAAGLSGVTEYEYQVNSGETRRVRATADGAASVTFRADEDSYRFDVRSRSANGFVSTAGYWSVYFLPEPSVRSDIYLPGWEPHGGVGVAGTFTFSPPPHWTEVKEYRYQFYTAGTGEETVAAGADGRATITWTPTASGWETLEVYAVRPDGSLSDSPNWYSFNVG